MTGELLAIVISFSSFEGKKRHENRGAIGNEKIHAYTNHNTASMISAQYIQTEKK